MCLEHVRKCKPKERVVYAVKHVYLDGSIGSIYNNFLWIVGEVYIARQRNMSDTPSKIEGGYFHTFKYLRDARKLASVVYKREVFKAIIPEGSETYKGIFVSPYLLVSVGDSYASTKLKLIRLVKK